MSLNCYQFAKFFLEYQLFMNDQNTSNFAQKFHFYMLFAKRYLHIRKLNKENCILDDFIPKIMYRLQKEKLSWNTKTKNK